MTVGFYTSVGALTAADQSEERNLVDRWSQGKGGGPKQRGQECESVVSVCGQT